MTAVDPLSRLAPDLVATPLQALVMKAALGDGDAALAAFAEWRQSIDLAGDFDRGTFRLLPLLYQNMRRLDCRDSLLGRLKGVYRLTWYENNLLFNETEPLVAELERQGIATMLIKGAALTLRYYGNLAVRPMADLDIVVRPADAHRAMAILAGQGWTRTATASDDDLRYRHAMLFTHRQHGGEVDLHWHILYEGGNAAADEFFWSTAQPLTFCGVKTQQLDPTSMLLHTIIHGLRWNPEPPIRWIIDAMVILRQSEAAIDWQRLVAFAGKMRLCYRLWLGLAHLVARFDAPVPTWVLDRLAAAGISLLERIENSVVLHDRDRLYAHPIIKNWVIFADYCRISSAHGPLEFLSGFSHYVRYAWHLRGRSEIVPTVVRGVMRRILPGRLRHFGGAS
jgi:hypothetical protein